MQGLTLTTRLDVASPTITYIGKASVGSLGSEAVWRLFRLTSDAGGGIIIEYANGDASFNYVWDARASYSYS